MGDARRDHYGLWLFCGQGEFQPLVGRDISEHQNAGTSDDRKPFSGLRMIMIAAAAAGLGPNDVHLPRERWKVCFESVDTLDERAALIGDQSTRVTGNLFGNHGSMA
jgi:hypothetical protein